MRFLDDPMFLRDIIMDHYESPRNHKLVQGDSTYYQINMDSATCIDNIDVQLKMEEDVIKDIRFDGEACAISTASTSIMSELLKGKSVKEAKAIIDNYLNMIYEKEYNPDILQEAIAFKNTHKQANRIKCATLGWIAVTKLIEQAKGEVNNHD